MVGKLAGAGSRVAVLVGGLSAEREVSLSSGHECAKALR
ncbi:MAG: D-alanine--D-alanine ligase, partial [Pseudomonadota bacterium]